MTEPSLPVRNSPRWKNFDYSSATGYFITLCTHNRTPILGSMRGTELVMSASGLVAAGCWLDLPQQFPTLVLDEYIVMPNHLHALLFLLSAEEIVLPGYECDTTGGEPVKPATLSEIVRYFKTASAKRINRLRKTAGLPVWQRSFYDHVVRRDDSIDAIRS